MILPSPHHWHHFSHLVSPFEPADPWLLRWAGPRWPRPLASRRTWWRRRPWWITMVTKCSLVYQSQKSPCAQLRPSGCCTRHSWGWQSQRLPHLDPHQSPSPNRVSSATVERTRCAQFKIFLPCRHLACNWTISEDDGEHTSVPYRDCTYDKKPPAGKPTARARPPSCPPRPLLRAKLYLGIEKWSFQNPVGPLQICF